MIHCSTLIAIVLLFGKDRALAEQRASPLSDLLRRRHRRASQGHRLVDMVSFQFMCLRSLQYASVKLLMVLKMPLDRSMPKKKKTLPFISGSIDSIMCKSI